MPLKRLKKDEAYRLYLASPLAFANWQAPTVAELNANPTNDPSGLIYNLSCALDVGQSQFDLNEPDTDDSLVFCQTSGSEEITEYSATIVYAIQLAKERWTNAASLTEVDAATGMRKFNSSTLAQSLLTWRGLEYLAIMSVGSDVDAPFAVDDRLKIARVATDWAIPTGGSGEMQTLVQNFASREVSDLAWNYKLTA